MTRVPPSMSSKPDWAAVINHPERWTEADFEALPEGVRAELHHGRLILSPSAAFVHNWAITTLCMIFRHAVGDKKLVGSDTDVRMADGEIIYRPDVLVLRKAIRGRPIAAANVQLVVEILSPGGGVERTLKMTDYAQAGIPSYLIVEPIGDQYGAAHYVLTSGQYELAAKAEAGGVLVIETPFRAVVDLTELDY